MTAAVLLTCHGTVERLDDIPAFLANIRRGRPTPPEVIDEVRRRFERIGGSPLMRITGAQADALTARLGIPVAIAGRTWAPYPRDVLASLHAAGARTIVSLPLAPQWVHTYHPVVRQAAAGLDGLDLRCVPPWGMEPALIDAFLETIDEAVSALGSDVRSRAAIVLTAHSLPQRVIDAGDPYERMFRELCAEVARRLAPRDNAVHVAFQSQGMTTDPWIGPDLPTTFARLAADGIKDVLIAPIGFVSDHVETLYDLDIEAPELAAAAGLRLTRAAAVNTRPRFIDALEAVARRALGTNEDRSRPA